MVEIRPVPERVQTNQEAADLLKNTFEDAPIMIRVAECESQLRQWKEDGKVLKGVVNSLDTGIYQINLKYHQQAAESIGLDVFTAEGNVAYARYLYDQQGTKPWMASSECWRK